jgi:hypothetical protein
MTAEQELARLEAEFDRECWRNVERSKELGYPPTG